jgi:outer membrane protein assembly factor BamB
VVAPLLTGQVYFDQSTTLTGATVLADATVYVNGDLTVAGTVVGNGTVFVDGDTTFLQAVNVTGTSRITLFSQGDITFVLPSVFQGVLYSHGNVNSVIALLVSGAVYAVNETDTSKGNVTLGPGSLVVHVQELTTFANYYLGLGGQAEPAIVYWHKIR